MTVTEKKLKQFMIVNGFYNHLNKSGLIWSDKIDVGIVREFVTICLDWLHFKQVLSNTSADTQIDWYLNYKKYFPTAQLMEDFVEILENNKCDYKCRQPQRRHFEEGYITEEFYNEYWNY
jgi:hypothetical protein